MTEGTFNYASSNQNPQFQKEVKGGRAVVIAKLTAENYASRDGIAGISGDSSSSLFFEDRFNFAEWFTKA